MDRIIYKGYKSSFQYDCDTKSFYLFIEGITDYVSSITKNENQIEKDFKELVDNYLMVCHKAGKIPEKPFCGKVEIELSKDEYKLLLDEANRKKVAFDDFINFILKQYIDFIS